MTMQHQIHPDDERLAALAGGDADATADAGLRAHVTACDRCGPMVADLQQLRTALAELPDLVPSRRLQLVPPAQVVEPRRSGGWLRRIAAPMLAGGAGLVLVGLVGTSGVLTGFGSLGAAAAPSAADMAEGGAGQPAATDSRRNLAGESETPALTSGGEFSGASRNPNPSPPSKQETSPGAAGDATGSPEPADLPGRPSGELGTPVNPWAIVLLAGVVLVFLGGVVLVTQPGRGP